MPDCDLEVMDDRVSRSREEFLHALNEYDPNVASGDSASLAGRTCSNTEQAPKQLMQEPTRPSLGEGRRRSKGTSESIPSVTAGVVVTAMQTKADQTQHGKPQR